MTSSLMFLNMLKLSTKILSVVTFSLFGLYYTSVAGDQEYGTSVFSDPVFWHHFVDKVKSKAWSCDFNDDILQSSLEKDAALYEDDTVFRKRRFGARQWTVNTTLWSATVLGACKEITQGKKGVYSHQLKDLNMLEAFSDYVHHLNYFEMVAHKMSSLGEKVKPFSQHSSGIHDIDKLDPIMMVGYSEFFEDKANTSVWNLCVERHTTVNPHHQAHCMWHGCCKDTNNGTVCEKRKRRALREMVCDKVSRRVQKDLEGKLTTDMWNVDIAFFAGLPEDWLDEARDMMLSLKRNDDKLHKT